MLSSLPPAYINGTGSYLPANVLDNKTLEKLVETSDDWIIQRTGISERRKVIVGEEASSDLGANAALKALEIAQIKPSEIDFILCATITPDTIFPSTACHIQRKLEAYQAACLDISAACTGFPYALSIAQQFIATQTYRNILVIGAECLSTITDYTNRETCILFGDGAGAVVVQNKGTHQILGSKLYADGSDESLMLVPAGGSRNPASHKTVDIHEHYMHINGHKVFQFAVKKMTSLVEEALAIYGQNPVPKRVMIVPHQVNIRIIQVVQKKLNIPEENIIVNLNKYGNTSSASIPIALDEAARGGRIQSGDLVILPGFGGGLTWGFTALRW
ncbi:MAG: beta-ketoacyl-ACP synthase III [Planctomycetota bacterium]